RRPGADSRALDLAARPGDAQGSRPPRELGVPRSEAAARRARELPRTPARGERRQAGQRRASAAARGWCRAARLGRGLHTAREPADRRGPGAARDATRGRARPRREPAGAEAAERTLSSPPAPPQEERPGRAESAAAAAERPAAGRGEAERRAEAARTGARARTVTPRPHEGP